ncbi:MAG: FkbM family methyltransferase [Planctomycetes bacterium]|nr:FkbM family methyltransferase [Planctomycetota bacterium]
MNRVVRKFLRACGLYDPVVDLKNWLARTQAEYMRFYSQFVNRGDLCFDVGANVGRRTKVLLELNASVVVVEPQEHCMSKLRKKYGGNSNVVLVQKAVGKKEGHAEMMLCDSCSLSSLSKDWIESVKASGRYSACSWNKIVTVPMVTLDDLISQYGKPAFMKIDVEGYEYQVLKGLSQPIKVICFEFTPEFMDSAIKCVEHLSKIGPAKFNYCLDDKPTSFVLSKWYTSEQMREVLGSVCSRSTVGDIYVKFDN